MEQIVTGCGNCPFQHTEGDWCRYPNVDLPEIGWEFWGNEENTPYWCPLKKEPLTISIK